MKPYLIFCILFVSGCSSFSKIEKSVPPPNYSPSTDILVYDSLLTDYYQSHSEICISETWPEEFSDKSDFDEVDEWLAPAQIDTSTFVVSLKPRELEGRLFFVADSFYHMRQYETARQFYKKVIEVNPNNWFAYLNIGDTFFIGDEFDTAAVWFKKSIEVNGFNWKSWKYLADLYNSTGQKEKAIDATVRSIILNPYGFEAWSLLAYLGKKYNFEIWNPQDSVFMKRIIQKNDTCLVYRTNHSLKDKHLIELASKAYLISTNPKHELEIYSDCKLAESNRSIENEIKRWAFSYEIYIRNWTQQKDSSNPDLYIENPYNEYLETAFRTHNLRFHIFWSDILRENPKYGMYLSVEEFDQMTEFFIDNYLLTYN